MKHPRDTNQLAKHVVDLATCEATDEGSETHQDDPMSELGRQGGLKGGIARAKKLSPERRKEIARKAAATRWAAKVEKDG